MEYLSGGELYTLLIMKWQLPIDVGFYGAEILVALAYLHENNIVYRDLKPENVLLDALVNIRLIDFGLVHISGSPYYITPEMIHENNYCIEVDYWPFGVILFEMMTGKVPFTGNSTSL